MAYQNIRDQDVPEDSLQCIADHSSAPLNTSIDDFQSPISRSYCAIIEVPRQGVTVDFWWAIVRAAKINQRNNKFPDNPANLYRYPQRTEWSSSSKIVRRHSVLVDHNFLQEGYKRWGTNVRRSIERPWPYIRPRSISESRIKCYYPLILFLRHIGLKWILLRSFRKLCRHPSNSVRPPTKYTLANY